MKVIQFEHVDVVFGPHPSLALELMDEGMARDEILNRTRNIVAVRDASLSVEEGQICVLMGLSGSGKSSLLKCVNGLNTVTRGRVLVRHGDQEVDPSDCDRTTLHRLRTERVGMVFQRFALMPWRTVGENVAFGLELKGLSKSERLRIVAEKLALVRLDGWADKHPHELSGGMQQRVGLARALATDADVLLMDEPFSALDPLIRQHLQDELLQLQAELKKTILFVSHDLDEALKLGSRIAIMEAGRIVQIGAPEAIVSNPGTDYVRRFVASVNPLSVLSCATLMRPVAEMPETGVNGDRVLSADKNIVCSCDTQGRLKTLTRDGAPLPWVAFHDDLDLSAMSDRVLVIAGLETPIKAAVEIYRASDMPLAVVDEDSRLVGVVGKAEIFDGLLSPGAARQ